MIYINKAISRASAPNYARPNIVLNWAVILFFKIHPRRAIRLFQRQRLLHRPIHRISQRTDQQFDHVGLVECHVSERPVANNFMPTISSFCATISLRQPIQRPARHVEQAFDLCAVSHSVHQPSHHVSTSMQAILCLRLLLLSRILQAG